MNVKKLAKRSALIGLGLASIARERAMQLAKQLERRGQMSAKGKKQLINKMSKLSLSHSRKIQNMMERELIRSATVLAKAAEKEARRIAKTVKKEYR